MNSKVTLVVLVAAVTAVLLLTLRPSTQEVSFEQWKIQHGKVYSSPKEENFRERIFRRNVAKVDAHNADKTQTYQMGINQFTDMTQEEFAAQYLTLKVNRKYENEHPMLGMTQEGLKANIDWVADGKVTPVKNQGQCGSCWAFSAIAAVESAVLLAGRPQQLFSEQQLVDCSRGYGNAGCNGGWMDSAFKYIIDNGITTSAAYPYAARDQTCAIQGGSFKIKGFIDTPSCTSLTNALSGRPISVAVDASNWSPYRSGVFSNCGTSVNHGVLLVGATDSTWVIKNSWGGSWGDNGFIRLSQGNTCAVCGYPSYPTI